MSDDAAHEWLTVCATDVRDLPISTLRAAAAEAAKTCTHHGQIIPTILASSSVKMHEQHKRVLNRLAADGHSVSAEPNQIEHRGGAKPLGQIEWKRAVGREA